MGPDSTSLQKPYEIGNYIVSQMPTKIGEYPWADSDRSFYCHRSPQMKQGLLLQVVNSDLRPRGLVTRYGFWQVTGGSSGSFQRIFEVVKKTLNLEKVEGCEELFSAPITKELFSYYAIKTWNGESLEDPVLADEKAGEKIPPDTAFEVVREFQKSHSF